LPRSVKRADDRTVEPGSVSVVVVVHEKKGLTPSAAYINHLRIVSFGVCSLELTSLFLDFCL